MFRNIRDLVEAKRSRWKDYIQEQCKKDLNEQDYYNNGDSNLEPDILEFEVKWALGSMLLIKLVDVMKFQYSYLKP